MTKQAIFVYGTLRTGFHNYNRLLKGRVNETVDATLKGFDMYSIGGSYPAIVSGSGEVTGELMYIDDENYDETMRSLDWLEGYTPQRENHSMYLRITLTVVTADGELVDAYVYLWNRPVPDTKIASGDWVNFKQGNIAI